MKQIELERKNLEVNNPDKNKLEPGLKIEIVKDVKLAKILSNVALQQVVSKSIVIFLSLKGKKKFNHVTKTLTNSHYFHRIAKWLQLLMLVPVVYHLLHSQIY